MTRLRSGIRNKQSFRQPLAGKLLRRTGHRPGEAQPLHQLQRFALIRASIGCEPFVQLLRNSQTCQDVAAIKIGGNDEIGRAAFLQFAIEHPGVDFMQTGFQRDRFLIALNLDRSIAAAGKRAPDVDERLPQAIACLRIATSRPECFGKRLAPVAPAAGQDQGREKKRSLAR